MNYNFSQLNDKEFEILSVDLLSTIYGERIERFKPGKDTGIDGRFYSKAGQETIIQCKHYIKSGYKALIIAAKKEAKKLSILTPERYIFVTSLQLSPKNKLEIKKIFYPYVKISNDIFGQEDLNDIISKNPEIEEKHFKLWIESTNILTRIINNAIKGRSEFEIKRIRKNAYKYVTTEKQGEAKKILDKNNVLIISGEPGIGKTTLAENICLYYVAKDYMFIDIEEDLSEAEQVYKRGEKQLFYFDDFLGSNYFEAIENKKDSHIIKFIDRVKNDNSKKFILTSRTNILNSGIFHSSIFYNGKIRNNEFLLSIDSLTNLEKAYILYNHIWFSKLSIEYIDEIYKEKRYREIIAHKNFNPRLIEFITDIDRVDVPESEYWNFVVATLENPKDIWNNYFKVQSNSFVRNLVMLTVFNEGRISEDDLMISYNELSEIENINNPSHTEKDFKSTALMAVSSFLNREKTSLGNSYSLFNPSIGDFILHEYSDNIPKLIDVYKSLHTVESLKTLISLEKENIISTINLSKILDELFLYSFQEEKSIDYLIFLSYQLADDIDKKDQILQLLNQLIKTTPSIGEYTKFIELLIKYSRDLDILNLRFLIDSFENNSLGYYDLQYLACLIEDFSVDDQEILLAFAEQIEDYLTSEIYQIINDNVDLEKYISFTQGEDYEEMVELNASSLLDDLRNCLILNVEDILGMNIKLRGELDINYSNVANAVDVDELRKDYINAINAETEPPDDYDRIEINLDNDVDDLFERT